MAKRQKIKIQMPDGTIIERVPTFRPLGNFCMVSVTIDGIKYSVGDGDEYLRGYPDVWRLTCFYDSSLNKVVFVEYPKRVKYKLLIDGRIETATLTNEEIDAIKSDLLGKLQREYLIKLDSGEVVETGIIDGIIDL